MWPLLLIVGLGVIWNWKKYRRWLRNWGFLPKGSKGEQRVARWLDQQGYTYSREVNLGPGRYDFQLWYPCVLIEFDGRQHFRRSPHFHPTPAAFRRAQQQDRKKTRWAQRNGWRLIRLATGCNVEFHLEQGMNSSAAVYLSNPDRYAYL